MNKNLTVNPIGKIEVNNDIIYIWLDKEYIQGLKELSDFSHAEIIWWFSESDKEEYRNIIEVESPYKNSPEIMGTFATRSPFRPNPIALSVIDIADIDLNEGIIKTYYIDAYNNSPVLDIKPYTPSLDRVKNPSVPYWCEHWPKSIEESAYFNWENEFNF